MISINADSGGVIVEVPHHTIELLQYYLGGSSTKVKIRTQKGCSELDIKLDIKHGIVMDFTEAVGVESVLRTVCESIQDLLTRPTPQ